MKRIACLLAALLTVVGIVAPTSPASGRDDGSAAPIFGIKIFPGYRDWRLISVAREEGNLNDIRAILGNNIAIKAYRQNKLPFPDGTVIAHIAWKDVPSEENDKVFGRNQSFVAGPAPEWYLQFMVKDSKKFAAPAAGASLNSAKTANLPTRRSSKPASHATSLSRQATLYSLVMHRRTGASLRASTNLFHDYKI